MAIFDQFWAFLGQNYASGDIILVILAYLTLMEQKQLEHGQQQQKIKMETK